MDVSWAKTDSFLFFNRERKYHDVNGGKKVVIIGIVNSPILAVSVTSIRPVNPVWLCVFFHLSYLPLLNDFRDDAFSKTDNSTNFMYIYTGPSLLPLSHRSLPTSSSD